MEVTNFFNLLVVNLLLHTYCVRVGYLEFQDTYGQNSNGYTHVFEVELFNGVVDDVTGSCVIPEIDNDGRPILK